MDRKAKWAALILALLPAGGMCIEDVPTLAGECEACHGPAGVSTETDVPPLAGKSVTWLREMLDQFHNYERHCTTTTYRHGDRARTPTSMCGIANSLSDEDKQALAEYFANAVPNAVGE